jgi:ribosomal protein S9
MEKDVFSATGRRKAAVARVRVAPGKGVFSVNGRPIGDYLMRETLVQHAQQPLQDTETLGSLDVTASTRGGGVSGQAGAILLAVSRARPRGRAQEVRSAQGAQAVPVFEALDRSDRKVTILACQRGK